MALEPSYIFRGNALINNGEVLPFYFSSPNLVIECIQGNAPPSYIRVGWATALFNSDIGGQSSGSPISLLFGKRFYNFQTFPFDPSIQAYQLKINLRSWIEQLEANFYEVSNWKEVSNYINSELSPTFPPGPGPGIGGGNFPPGLL
jgi:hypothetical protein